MRFIVDEMLARLGRWLRAAGYDTLVASGITDQEILDLAIKEERTIVTRDRHFLEMEKAQSLLIFLESNTTDQCAKELSEKLDVKWTIHPFTRCLLCNDLLKKMEDGNWICGKCNKTYWLGSHTKRMLKQLKKWDRMDDV